MVRTRVGYTGGRQPSPTYTNLGDHTEAVQVGFDPTQTSYERLLEVFLATDNRCAWTGKRQYMTAVFYHNEAQKQSALEALRREEARLGERVAAEVLPATPFYLAEDYHQKYQLRLMPDLLGEFQAIYPRNADFLASTAVARVNGYLAGHGSETQLRAEVGRLGLSANGQKELVNAWKSSRRQE